MDFTDFKVFIVLIIAGWSSYLFMPVLALTIVTAILILYFMGIKMYHLDELFGGLDSDEILMLWITKGKKILLERATEDMDGYLTRGDGWGRIKNIQDSTYWFYGKPCVVGLSGVPFSTRMEHVEEAEEMEEEGIQTREQLQEFLEVEEEGDGSG